MENLKLNYEPNSTKLLDQVDIEIYPEFWIEPGKSEELVIWPILEKIL